MGDKKDIQLYYRLGVVRQTAEKKTIRVALVSELEDSYRTIIDPEGCVSPLASVPVDYNHNRISTGAEMRDLGIQEIEVEVKKGVTEKVRARVVEIDVYKDSKMRTHENESDEASIPSLYEAVENGRIKWASVDFEPIEEHTEYVHNSAGKKIREVYNKWRLNFFSLLDTKPGQDTSYFLNVRSFLDINKDNMSKDKKKSSPKKEESRSTDDTKKRAEWTPEFVNALPDSAFVIIEPAFLEGDVEDKNARHLPYIDDKGEVDLPHLKNALARVDQIEAVTDSISTEDLRKKASEKLEKLKEEFLGDEKEVKGEDEDKKDEVKKPAIEEKREERSRVGDVIESKDGMLALVTDKKDEVLMYKMLSGETGEAGLAEVAEVGEDMGEKSWKYITSQEAFSKIFEASIDLSKLEGENKELKQEVAKVGDEKKDMESRIAKLKESKGKTKDSLRSIEEKYKKLANSPSEGTVRSSDAMTDLEGDEDIEEKLDPIEEQRQANLRNIYLNRN